MSVEIILTSLLSFLTGLWGATYLQDREGHRRHLGIVRALKAEVERIATESNADSEHPISISFLGMRPQMPALSPWVGTILTDIASTSPDLVEQFLALDRHLENLKHADAALQQVSELSAAAARALGEADSPVASASTEEIVTSVVAKLKAKREVEGVERTAELADHSLETSLKYVRSSLTRLRGLMDKLEKELEAGIWTHLPWRGR